MQSITDILQELINDIENDVIHSMQLFGRVATGKTIGQFETQVTDNKAELITPLSIDALELGRSPTSPNAPAGDPTVYEAIVEWAQAKGIPQFDTDDKGKQVNVWRAITASIHKKGFKATPGVLSEPLSEDNMNNRTKPAFEKIAAIQGQEIADLFSALEV